MEYGKTNDPDRPYKFTFGGWEIKVVQAAYTESTIHRELKGNSSSVSDFDAFIVGFPKSKKKMELYPTSTSSIAEILEEFADRTDDEVNEIVRLPIPSYENRYVAQRRMLGEWATDLAAEIRKITDQEPPLSEAEEEVLRQIEDLPEKPD